MGAPSTAVAAGALATLACCSCGGSGAPSTPPAAPAQPTALGVASGGPTTIEIATPPGIARAGKDKLQLYEAGKRDVAQSGCLACHRIGASGNDGPGPNLSQAGGRLPKQAIARTLVNPTAPMPSFRHLPQRRFHEIVSFLADLK